jgi:hypothetical protein
MKNKIFAVVAFFVVVLFSLSMVSAGISVSNVAKLSRTSGSFDLTISSTENETIIINDIEDIVEGTNKIIFSVNDTVFDILDNETRIVSVSYDVESGFEFGFNSEYNTDLNVSGNESDSVVRVISFDVNEDFCEEGCENVGRLKIDKLKIELSEGMGDDDDDYFYPMDDIEVSFRVDNDGDWDIDNIEILMCLYDVDSDDCVFDEDDFDIDSDDFDLKDGKDIDIVATLEIDPDELTAGNNDYKLFVSAVGEIDDRDDIHDGELTSVSDFLEFDIITDDDFVVVDNFELNSDVVCGSNLEISAKVWNVGDQDLDDDEVYVRVFSNALGIDENFRFENGIDEMDYEEIILNFDVPSYLDEDRSYYVDFSVYEKSGMNSNDLFETSEEEKKAEYNFPLKAQNCDVETNVPEPIVDAELINDEAVVGEEVLVKILITNPAGEGAFAVSVNGYDSWAELVSIESNILNLGAGESGEVLVKLTPTSDGLRNFNVRVVSNDNDVSWPVSLNVNSKSGAAFNFENFSDNAMYWLAGILVVLIVLLFVLILIFAVRRR